MSYTSEILELFKGRVSSDCSKLEFAAIKDNQVHSIINEKTTLVETEGILFVYESIEDQQDIIY